MSQPCKPPTSHGHDLDHPAVLAALQLIACASHPSSGTFHHPAARLGQTPSIFICRHDGPCQRLNLHFPMVFSMVFPWFFHGFSMAFP